MVKRAGLKSMVCGIALLPWCAAALAATGPAATVAAPASKAAPAAAPVLPSLTAEQIADRNVAARGGLAAWRATKTISWKGTMGVGGTVYETVTPKGQLQQKQREEMRIPFRFEFKRPQMTRLELDFNGQTAIQVFDGTNGWKLRPYLGRKEWEAFSADEVKQAGAEPGIDGYLIDYSAKGARVELAGTDKVEGHDAYKVKVTRRDGQVRYVWVDALSFLDLKVDGEPRKFDNKMRTVEIYTRDFRAEQGLMLPHVFETVVQAVKGTEKIILESVSVNPPLDDARFTKSK
jgi:hypothetical protein